MALRSYKASWKDKKGKPHTADVFFGNVDPDREDEDVEREYADRHADYVDVKLERIGTTDKTPKEVIEQRPE